MTKLAPGQFNPPPDSENSDATAVESPLSPDERQVLTLARLVALAMLTGAAAFLLVLMTTTFGSTPPATPAETAQTPGMADVNTDAQQPTAAQADSELNSAVGGEPVAPPPLPGPSTQAPLSTVVILQLGWSAAVLVSLLGYPAFRQPLIRHVINRPADDVDPQTDRLLIARSYLSVTLLTCGLAAGLSVLGAVVFAASQRPFDLLLAAGPLLMFVFLVPTTQRLVRFRQSISDRRTLSIGR